MEGTSLGSKADPPLLSDPNKTLSGPGSLVGKGVGPDNSQPCTKNPGHHGPSALGEGQPLEMYVQREPRGGPSFPSSAVHDPHPTPTE